MITGLCRIWEKNLRACAPRNNGIIRVVFKDAAASEDQPAGLSLFECWGVDGDGKKPLWLALWFHEGEVGIMVKMAKGRNAEDVQWGERLGRGDRGTGRDNIVVLAALLLAAIHLFGLGYLAMANTPVNEKLRRLYAMMGFENGERLELKAGNHMRRLIQFVANHLSSAGIDLDGMNYRWEDR